MSILKVIVWHTDKCRVWWAHRGDRRNNGQITRLGYEYQITSRLLGDWWPASNVLSDYAFHLIFGSFGTHRLILCCNVYIYAVYSYIYMTQFTNIHVYKHIRAHKLYTCIYSFSIYRPIKLSHMLWSDRSCFRGDDERDKHAQHEMSLRSPP